jgi:ribonuclease I
MSLRIECLKNGISEISTQTQGDRTMVRFVVHALAPHVRERVAHRYGSRAFDATAMELTATLEGPLLTVEPLTQLVREIWMGAPSVA